MQEIYKRESKTGYRAFINGGCINYEDDMGAYKIPLGRRTHHCLIRLEDNEQVTRSLEIDLLTGNVYYAVDNHTDTGLAYYYDMTMQKVWNNRILRLLQSIRNEALKPAPEIRKVIRKLPCEDWAEILSILPGWQEAYMQKLIDEYTAMLTGPGAASDKFWDLENVSSMASGIPG